MMLRTVCILFVTVFFACKETKQRTVADEDLTIKDFLQLSPELKLPFAVHDSILQKKEKDSAAINQKVFQSFVPDSVYKKNHPVTRQLKLFVLGKSTDAQKGNYVFIKSVAGNRKAVHLYYFDEKNSFTGSTKLLDNTPSSKPGRYVRIDSRYNISFIKEQRTPTGEVWTDESIYYMDTKGNMILTMTNSTQDRSDEIMGNPIDTLPRKNKYSADYSGDKKNLVSIRDGRTSKTFQFFIHFSKQNGECVGELKGEGEFTANGKGVFHDKGSPCEILFSFTTNSVSMKETNGCGSYRDITCFFEGTYPRKKEAVKRKSSKKK